MISGINKGLVNYPWIIGGNEPDIPRMEFFDTANFALLGCGVFRPIETIFQVTKKTLLNDMSLNQSDIPKLIILDCSITVQEVWSRLKERTVSCCSLDDFLSDLEQNPLQKDLYYFGCMDNLKFRLSKFCKQENDYQVFRKIVFHAEFILGNWTNEADIQQVKMKSKDKQLAIYASNIAEVACTESDSHQDKVLIDLMSKLMSLDPIISFYALTSEEYVAINDVLKPDKIVSQQGSNLDEHLNTLSDNGFSCLSCLTTEYAPAKKEFLPSFQSKICDTFEAQESGNSLTRIVNGVVKLNI